MNELVSIIIPTYNVEKYIAETLESILAQTYANWEVEITDDCSTDKTVEIIRYYALKDSRIHLQVLEHNSGSGPARNSSIKRARGRYISFMDSDDWWYPTKLEEQIQFMQINDYPFTCTYYEDADSNLNSYYIVVAPEKRNFNDLLYGASVGTPGIIYDTNKIKKVFMPSLRNSQDWATWLLILKQTTYLYTYPKVMWKYRHISTSATSNKFKHISTVIDVYQKVLGFSRLKSYCIFIFLFMPKQIVKKTRKRIGAKVATIKREPKLSTNEMCF